MLNAPALPETRPPPRIGIASPSVADADAAAEEQIDLAGIADREEAGVLEEERPLLREEQREAIEVDLLIVDLDLREVGVDGRVERQARREAVLDVAADIAEHRRIDRPARPTRATLPSTYGVTLKLRIAGVWMPATVPASDRRYRLYCRGIGAQ